MKKFIAILLVICLVFAGAVGYMEYKKRPVESKPDIDVIMPESADTSDIQPAGVRTGRLDFAAMYLSRQPDEVVMTVDGRDITWQEYFYWFYFQASQMESYFDTMAAYYGTQISWNDAYEGSPDQTYAQAAAESTVSVLKELYSIEKKAEENSIELSEDDRRALNEQLLSDIASVCGEGASEEDFFEAIADMYMTRDIYERLNRANYLYINTYKQLYGEKGELVNDEDTLAYLEENGYIYANHILYANSDRETGEKYDEAVVAEKLAAAESAVDELRAIGDKEELVRRFAEIKEEDCEDPGKVLYPNGYVFTDGKMVAEFEQTSKALGEYEVSDPVETAYGYHVIIRLPLSPDAVMDYTGMGTAVTAREVYANGCYNNDMQDYIDNLVVEYKDGLSDINIMDYIIK